MDRNNYFAPEGTPAAILIIFSISLFLGLPSVIYGREVTILVEDIDLGLPLEGAEIRSWDGSMYVCDAEGRAQIQVPDVRQVVIVAAYPGYTGKRLLITPWEDSYRLGLRMNDVLESSELVIEAERPSSGQEEEPPPEPDAPEPEQIPPPAAAASREGEPRPEPPPGEAEPVRLNRITLGFTFALKKGMDGSDWVLMPGLGLGYHHTWPSQRSVRFGLGAWADFCIPLFENKNPGFFFGFLAGPVLLYQKGTFTLPLAVGPYLAVTTGSGDPEMGVGPGLNLSAEWALSDRWVVFGRLQAAYTFKFKGGGEFIVSPSLGGGLRF